MEGLWVRAPVWRLCQREPATKPSRQPPREPLQQLDVRLYDPQDHYRSDASAWFGAVE